MKKGLSPIIAVILVLLIAISLTVLAMIFLPRFTFKLFPEMGFNESYLRSRGCLSIEDVKGLFGFVTIKNCGRIALSNFKFFVDGKFISSLDIEKLEPLQSTSFKDMPIPGGKHEIYVTADYAESPPFKLDVPYWECMGGEPVLTGDWYVSKNISCICSYNSTIPLNGGLYVIENGSLSLYNCIIWLGGYNKYVNVRDNGFLNLTRSKITKPPVWGSVYFEDNSTVYLLNSTVNNPSPTMLDETNVTAINSDLGWPSIYSNMPHRLSVSDLNGRPSGSPITNYLKAEGSNFTVNFTNVTIRYVAFTISDNSNTTINNSYFYPFNIISEYNHNLTIRDMGCSQPFDVYFKAEGSDFEFNATNLSLSGLRFSFNGGSNNTVINTCAESVRVSYWQNSTNKFIGFNSWGNWYINGKNYTMNFKDSKISGWSGGSETVFGYCGSSCIPWTQWNFSNTNVSNRIFNFDYGNITFFGNITFLENVKVYRFATPDRVNVTRYYPTIIRDYYNSPFPTTEPARINITDINNQSVWEGSVSGGSSGTYYIEDPKIKFNSSNYQPGNFRMKVSQVCENLTDIHLLNNTSLEFTLQRAYDYDGTSFNTQGNRGLAFDNSYFWVANSNGYVYQYDASGSSTGFNFDSGLSDLRDVTSNGTYLWLLDSNTERVYRYTTGGTQQDYFSITDVINPYAVDFDGEYFWILGSSSVYKYSKSGNYLSSFNIDRLQTPLSYPDIIAFNGNIWILTDTYSESKGRGVFRYKTDGTYDNWYFDIYPPTTSGYGLAYNGTYFWVMNSTGTVFRYTLNKNCLEAMKQCDEFITFLPYTINKNDTRYCLLYDLYTTSENGIIFATNKIKNSTLDCKNYYIKGNDWGNDGIYLTGSNNTIKNCHVEYFRNGIEVSGSGNNIINNIANINNQAGIYLWASDNNVLLNNTVNGNEHYGILLMFNSDNNILINNTAKFNDIDTRAYGISISDSNNNTLINNVIYSRNGISISGSDNNITGGSITGYMSGSLFPTYDYKIGSGINNFFRNTNFTCLKEIYFFDSNSEFIYSNNTTGELWLKTSISSKGNITRELVDWSLVLMRWKDTFSNASGSVTATYNITTLVPHAPYRVYDNSVEIPGSPFIVDSSGSISFTINLLANEEHEIKVKSVCDYFIFSSGFTISENNSLYCVVSDFIDAPDQIAITFADGVQNSSLDCLYNVIDGKDISDTIGIYANKNYNISLKNCNFTDWFNSIYYNNSNYSSIYDVNISSPSGDTYSLIIKNSDNTILNNVTILDYYSVPRYGIDIISSNNSRLINVSSNTQVYALYINGINTYVSNSTFTSTSNLPVEIWPPIWLGDQYCNHKFTNVIGDDNKPIVYYNNTAVTISSWYNNFSEILLCNADNSIIDNLTMSDIHGIKAWASDYSNFSNMNISNSSLSFRFGSNNKFTNITSQNSGSGISITESDWNEFYNITTNNNDYGIYLGYNTHHNNVTNCNIANSSSAGIYLSSSSTDNIITNVAIYSSENGILIYSSSNNNILENINIIGNVADYGSYGLALSGSSYSNITNLTVEHYWAGVVFYGSDNHNVTNSKILSNTQGIRFYGSNDNNIIANNIIQDNNECGICIENQYSDRSNYKYNNLFNNTVNFEFKGTIYKSYWNTTRQIGTRIYSPGTEIGGNYWTNPNGNGYSDNCNDLDADGFCDEQYNLTSDGKNIDYLPLSSNYTA